VAREHSEKARARAKAWAPDFDAARRPAGLLIPDGIAGLTGRLRETISEWAAAEAAPGRMLPWVPVSFGLGIVGYFAADREPTWWASVTFAFLTSSWPVWRVDDQSPFRWRQTWRRWPPGLRQPRCRRCVLHIRSCCIWYRARWLPVSSRLARNASTATASWSAFNVLRRRALGQRQSACGLLCEREPRPAVGSFVEFKAHLSPPLQPLRPGGYEFARDMYFQRIGASGYALVKVKSPPVAQGFWLRYASIIDALREGIDKRIRGVTGGDHGSIASALITGKRDTISGPVNDAMYVSSLSFVASCRCAIGLWSNRLRIADLGFI
jgi:competence protein ComEC